CHRFLVNGGLEIRAGYGDQRRLVEAQFRTEQRRFQSRCVGSVSHQRVCQTMRLAIHWSRNGNSAILVAPSAAVLNGGEQTWSNDRHATSRLLCATHKGSRHG